MISSKKLPGLTAWLLVLALAAAFFVPVALGTDDGVTMAYEETLFGQEMLTVDIVMEEAEWESLLQNAVSETYQSATVVINNEKYANVGIRCKGNTSLSTVASMGSERYSLRIKFDEYSTGGNCDGLSMLVLNNLMGDETYLKEYFTYDMFHYLGADASLFTMARVTVNGEPWGVYLALEAVDENMLLREYGEVGELYKPDSMNFNGGGNDRPDMGDFEMPDMGAMPDMGNFAMPEGFDMGNFEMPEGMEFPGMEGFEMPANGEAAANNETAADGETSGGSGRERGGMDFGGMDFGGFGGMGGGGSSLNYTDDSLDSYSTIWNGAKTDTTEADHRRVVEALRGISEGDLETYMDVDNMLRYMAVQTFVVNLDSLTGSMSHNYYLYEDDGKLNLLPWDYNLALGGFQGGDATEMINFPIDTPFTSSMENRQFFRELLENETYQAQYHEYLRVLCEEYVGTVFPQTYAAMRLMLDELVASEEADPSAFYTNEEYQTAAEMLKKTIERRAESILGQLDGSIPSTRDGQNAEPEKLLDSSDIDLDVMGRQFGGGGDFGGFGGREDRGDRETDAAARPDGAESGQTGETSAFPADLQMPEGMTMPQGGNMPDMSGFEMPSAGEMPDMGNFELPEGFDAGSFEMPEGGFPNMPQGGFGQMPQNMTQSAQSAAPGSDLTGAAEAPLQKDPAAESPAENTDPAAGDAGSSPADGAGGGQQGGRENAPQFDMSRMFGGMDRSNGQTADSGAAMLGLAVTGGALALLVIAFVFAKLYHRRRFRSK